MAQALEVVNSDGVRGYVDDKNVAWLNVEDVARGLGFVETKGGVEYVRWRTINGYLREFGFSQDVAKEDYIPENMFYRLAMKASNAAAQKFQAKVADEILPSIRKSGMYINPNAPIDPRFLRRMADELEARDKKIAALQPKADYCEKVLESSEHLTSELIAKEYGQSAHWLHETLIKLGVMYMRKRGTKSYYYLKSPYDKGNYRDSETVTLERGKTVVNHYWTQRGRHFVYQFLKKRGILPTAEREEYMEALL